MTNRASHIAILDARCLQDPVYAERGVGRHALAILRHAPTGEGGVRLLGITDPTLPPLCKDTLEVFDATCVNAYSAAEWQSTKRLQTCFVALSPMTHDPLFSALLMASPQLLRAAVVYDFIPHRHPERYLHGAIERLHYMASLRWLARSDVFAPISQSAADDLVELLGVPASAVVVTGAPIDPVFEEVGETPATGHRRHVLVVGGGDPRKNPEVVVRAHARSAVMQHGTGTPLVIGGNYSPDDARAFSAMSASAGGRPDLIEVPGHVTEKRLLEMYGGARALVSASVDEGFRCQSWRA